MWVGCINTCVGKFQKNGQPKGSKMRIFYQLSAKKLKNIDESCETELKQDNLRP